MNIGLCLLLGLIQGLTEFFFISSSAHSIILANLFGVQEASLFFSVLLHLGTLVALIIFLRKELVIFLKGVGLEINTFLSREDFKLIPTSHLRLVLLLGIALLPTALAAIIFKGIFEKYFHSLPSIGVLLLVNATFLGFTYTPARGKQPKQSMGQITYSDAFIIGLMQALALAPGMSRLGLTIAMGIYLGMERSIATQFSLLLSIPTILAALVFTIAHRPLVNIQEIPYMLAGAAVAGIAGFFCLRIMVRLIDKLKFHYFAYYCLCVGLFLLIFGR